MDVINIPFVEKIGIIRSPDGQLEIPFNQSFHNHLQTIHAGAQFALAETASGELLQYLFPELVDKVVPVLRESKIKYKKPAKNTISTNASITNDSLAKFKEQFKKKGRASILVSVEVKDQEGVVTSVSEFSWFVQGLESFKK